MTIAQESFLNVLAVLAIGAMAVACLLLVHKAHAASPQGATYFTGAFAGAVINLATPGANATSTSILNTTGNDLYVTGEKVLCEGVGTSKTAYTGTGLASATFTFATSSAAAPASNTNTNTLPVVTLGTSTPDFVISSSTAGTPGNNLVSNIWLAGSYMTITANATNTAVCTVGVDYIGS